MANDIHPIHSRHINKIRNNKKTGKEKMKQTTISIHQKTKDRLVKQGSFGESMNDVISKILDSYENQW